MACNEHFTAMHTGGRGNDDIDAGGILPDYAGIIVRDGYAGYQHFVDAVHALSRPELSGHGPQVKLGPTGEEFLAASEEDLFSRVSGRSREIGD